MSTVTGGLPGEENGRYLADRFLTLPGLARSVERIIAAGQDEDRRRGFAEGTPTEDARLRALQLFEYAAGVRPGTVHTRHDYRWAATFARKAGHDKGARILEAFGHHVDNDGWLGYHTDHLHDADLEPHHKRWAARHHAWSELDVIDLARLPGGPVLEHAAPHRGLDGAGYTLASCAGLPGGPRPAVVVRVSAARAEIVVFDRKDAAAAWLASRARGAAGPLLTTAGGPACRAVREDEVLARLLRHPGDAVRALAGTGTWTSHLRAELFLVMAPFRNGRYPDPDEVRQGFTRQLRRAPGWALSQIGWPDAHRALHYLDRLLATPVTARQALAAAQALAADQAPAYMPLEAETAGTLAVPRHVASPAVRELGTAVLPSSAGRTVPLAADVHARMPVPDAIGPVPRR